MDFIDLEKAYDRINREVLWQVLRMYDVEGKLLSGIKSIYVDSSTYVRVKGDESERFRIDSWVRLGCIMSSWLFIAYMDGEMKELKMGGVRFLEDRGEWIPGLLYAADLVLCGESEEDLIVTVGRSAEVCRRRGESQCR